MPLQNHFLTAHETSHPQLQISELVLNRVYDPYTQIDYRQKEIHMVHYAEAARRAFAAGDYGACIEFCTEVITSGNAAEAVRGQCYMYLATPVGHGGIDDCVDRKCGRYAQRAVLMWEMVVNRTGSSRFPLPQATAKLEEAEDLLAAANAEIALEEMRKIQ